MTLSARQAQAGLHESLHAAAVVYLGLTLKHVERKRVGVRHGAIGWEAGTDVENQVVYLMPLVGMIDSVGFDIGSHGYDVVEAKKIDEDLTPAFVVCRAALRDRKFKSIVHACWRKLMSQTELSTADIAEVRGA